MHIPDVVYVSDGNGAQALYLNGTLYSSGSGGSLNKDQELVEISNKYGALTFHTNHFDCLEYEEAWEDLGYNYPDTLWELEEYCLETVRTKQWYIDEINRIKHLSWYTGWIPE